MTSAARGARTLLLAVALGAAGAAQAQEAADVESWRELVTLTCLDCHRGSEPKGGLDLGPLLERPAEHRATWEHAFRRVTNGSMPPPESA
ncbi:MAG TPA: c-type cytochrome domain-containing protein, partial [Pseudomonadales bacterium]|nr:c-type cytochrome domain-containing protein [Pseudomonadales bacterium]